MILNFIQGLNIITAFPGTHSIPCSGYRNYIEKIYLIDNKQKNGVFSWFADQKDIFNFFTHFIPGSGTYHVHALSAFEMEY